MTFTRNRCKMGIFRFSLKRPAPHRVPIFTEGVPVSHSSFFRTSVMIHSAHLNYVRLPLSTPLRTAAGELSVFESVILTLESDSGTGRAEAPITVLPDVYFPHFVQILEQEIIPLLANRSISDTATLRTLLGKWSRNRAIYGLVEMAWHALRASEKKQPLCRILGAEPVSQQVFTSLDEPPKDENGYPQPDAFLDRIQKLYRAGYVHLELKVRPGWDIPMVRFVRQENPQASFHIDVEEGMGPENCDTLFQLRDFFPLMMEQPFHAEELVEHAELQRMLATCAVCLDESITSPGAAAAALKLKSAKVLKINPLRVGGFERAKEILAMCRETETECWISSPLATGTAVRSNLAFSSLDGFTGPFEYYDLLEYFTPEQLEGLELPPELVLDEENTLRIGEHS